MSESNPYAAPPTSVGSLLPEYPEPETAELASRFVRLLAAITDGILVIGIQIPILLFATDYIQRMQFGELSPLERLRLSLIGMVVWLALHGYLLITRGQTIGKLIFKIQIADYHDNRLLPFLRVYVYRNFWLTPIVVLSLFLPDGFRLVLNLIVTLDMLMIFTDERRCLHDYFAGSKVVKYVPTRSKIWGGIKRRTHAGVTDPVDAVAQQNYELKRLEKRVKLLERLARSKGKDESILEIIESTGSTPQRYVRKTGDLITAFLSTESDKQSEELAKEYLARTDEAGQQIET